MHTHIHACKLSANERHINQKYHKVMIHSVDIGIIKEKMEIEIAQNNTDTLKG